MKIGRTDTPGFDCFIVLTDKFLNKEEKAEIEKKIFKKHGEITVFFTSSVDDEEDLWTTNNYGLDRSHHEDYQNIDFEFVLFKDPNQYL